MPDITIANATNLVLGQREETLELHVVRRPFFPAVFKRPRLEDLTAAGVNNYRSRLIHHLPRTIGIFGHTGAETAEEARDLASRWQGVDGSYGRITYNQGGETAGPDLGQIRNVDTTIRKGSLFLSDGTEFKTIIDLSFNWLTVQ